MCYSAFVMSFLLVVLSAGDSGQNDKGYWSRIEELSKTGTPQGNPPLDKYLKSLTHQEMIQAAREFCQKYQFEISEINWPEASTNIGLALAFYPNEKHIIDDDKLDDLFTCIEDSKEGRFFRESMIYYLCDWCVGKGIMTDPQRNRFIQKLLLLLLDKNTPWQTNLLVISKLRSLIVVEYNHILLSDKNVKEFIKNNKNQNWQKVSNAVQKGEVFLFPETKKSLSIFNGQLGQIKKAIDVFIKDNEKNPDVVKQVGVQDPLKIINQLLVVISNTQTQPTTQSATTNKVNN